MTISAVFTFYSFMFNVQVHVIVIYDIWKSEYIYTYFPLHKTFSCIKTHSHTLKSDGDVSPLKHSIMLEFIIIVYVSRIFGL